MHKEGRGHHEANRDANSEEITQIVKCKGGVLSACGNTNRARNVSCAENDTDLCGCAFCWLVCLLGFWVIKPIRVCHTVVSVSCSRQHTTAHRNSVSVPLFFLEIVPDFNSVCESDFFFVCVCVCLES